MHTLHVSVATVIYGNISLINTQSFIATTTVLTFFVSQLCSQTDKSATKKKMF